MLVLFAFPLFSFEREIILLYFILSRLHGPTGSGKTIQNKGGNWHSKRKNIQKKRLNMHKA